MKNIFKKKKFVVILIVIIAIIVGIFYINSNKEAVETSANVVVLESKDIEQIISVKSPLEGIEKAEVVSPLNYEIIDIRVKEGDIVQKDQILAVLDNEELEKQIASEENQVELSRLQLDEKLKSLQIEYDKALLNITELEKNYEQNKELLENDIITKEAFDKIENSLIEAKKGLENFSVSDGKITASSAEIKSIEIQKQELDKKKEDLEKVYIKIHVCG